ncbi:MAG: MSMEG_0567/Sll0786 family nitrogen starvation N-acetyltransferase [Acidimicrobiales bacterium]
MTDLRTARRQRVLCRPVATPEELDIHHRIRHEVFVEEQELFAGTDRDQHDGNPDVVHVLAFLNDQPVGTVRLFPLDHGDRLWQGDRLAVLRPARILGLGRPLVRFAVATAGERGGREMVAHIQPQNVALFERLGWHKHGDIEVYVGVPHQPMAIDLRPARS